jgi:hypothetical protein
MKLSKQQMTPLGRWAAAAGLVLTLVALLAIPPVHAQPRGRPRSPVPGGSQVPAGSVIVRGTLTAIDVVGGTVQVTDRNGLSITLKTTSTTVIQLDGKTATLADLKTNDTALVVFVRATAVASRIVAASPPPVDLTGTITALDTAAGTVQVTTDHGTAVTLAVNSNTQIRLNGSATTIGNLAVGQAARVTYRAADKIALTLQAATPRAGVVSGAITALDLTAGTLQVTPLAGAAKTVKLNASTQFRLNGRLVAPANVVVGYLASVQYGSDDTATVVSAQTPPLVDLLGTISALDIAGGTFQVTTPGATTITLKLDATTAIQRDGAAATADKLVIGDQVQVRYEYRLTPGASHALRLVATSVPATTTPSVTLASVAVSPSSVTGGTAATGTVTLSGAAPAGGVVVTLTSSATTVATVPPSIMVPEGATSATFPVTTLATTAATPVTLTATLGSATSSATLTVTP